MRKYKYISILLVLVIVTSTTYCTSARASELAVGGAVLSSSGLALLGLLGLTGVGMELENNRKFNELADQEKARIENGLAQNFEEVGLQRGYALEQIKGWLSDLQKGVLNKSSEIWEYFKDWAKSVTVTDTSGDGINEDRQPVSIIDIQGVSFVNRYGVSVSVTSDVVSQINSKYDTSNYYGIVIYDAQSSYNPAYMISFLYQPSVDYIGRGSSVSCLNVNVFYDASSNTYTVQNRSNAIVGSYNGFANLDGAYKQIAIYSSYPVYGTSTTSDTNYNGLGLELTNEIFSTNTDYLERLKGKHEPIDVIDVTDIKHPIVVSQPNTVANINWNRGMNNNNDDDDKPKGALVPADVWYDHLDDYIEAQNDAIVEYDNAIQENPQDSDKIFISPAPIVNINNYNNTLPVINYPVGGTVVNNYYEYNNINNNNTTIYELPYNTDLIPMLPTLFFENKFPFCIPWDIYNFLAMFYVEKEAPRIDVPFPVKGLTMETETITIDLSPYNYLSDVLRVMFFVLFIVGLAFVTRYLIKG